MTGNINSDNVVTASAYSNFLNAKVMSNVKKKISNMVVYRFEERNSPLLISSNLHYRNI